MTRNYLLPLLLSLLLSPLSAAHAAPEAPPLAETRTTLYHADAIGSARLMSDETGAVTEHARYTPYGIRLGRPAAAESPAFAGKRHETLSETHDFSARHYASRHARFLSPDPVRALGEANLYTYARNNPLAYVDPDGRAPRVPRAPAAPQPPTTCGGGDDACEVGLTLLDMPDVIAYKLAYEMAQRGYNDWAAGAMGSAPYVAEVALPWAWERRMQRLVQRQALADLWIAEAETITAIREASLMQMQRVRLGRQRTLSGLARARRESLNDIWYAKQQIALENILEHRASLQQRTHKLEMQVDRLEEFSELCLTRVVAGDDPLQIEALRHELPRIAKEMFNLQQELMLHWVRGRIQAARLQETYLEALGKKRRPPAASDPTNWPIY